MEGYNWCREGSYWPRCPLFFERSQRPLPSQLPRKPKRAIQHRPNMASASDGSTKVMSFLALVVSRDSATESLVWRHRRSKSNTLIKGSKGVFSRSGKHPGCLRVVWLGTRYWHVSTLCPPRYLSGYSRTQRDEVQQGLEIGGREDGDLHRAACGVHARELCRPEP